MCVLGARVDLCFAFFAGFKWVSPGYLGDPYGYPRHVRQNGFDAFLLLVAWSLRKERNRSVCMIV
jgi:hypothetical protein